MHLCISLDDISLTFPLRSKGDVIYSAIKIVASRVLHVFVRLLQFVHTSYMCLFVAFCVFVCCSHTLVAIHCGCCNSVALAE